MSKIKRSARSENGEHAGIIEANGVYRTVLDLETGTESVSTHVRQIIGRVIYLGTGEQGVRASGIGDTEGVPREGAQDAMGIVEKFEGLIAGVGDGRGDLQVFYTINIGVGDRCFNGEAGGRRNDDGRGDEGDEGSTDGR